MQRSPDSREERNTLIALGVLVTVAVVAAVLLVHPVHLGGGARDRGHGASASKAVSTAPPSQPTPTTTAPPVSIQVQRGETLSSIARRFGVSIASIVAANRLPDQDRLAEGQTLLIPPPPPIALVITPATTTAGRSVKLQLTGAKPSESVTFEIASPNGTFTGAPHSASADGTVTATFLPDLGAPPGDYTVTARGSQGSTAAAGFRVESAGP